MLYKADPLTENGPCRPAPVIRQTVQILNLLNCQLNTFLPPRQIAINPFHRTSSFLYQKLNLKKYKTLPNLKKLPYLTYMEKTYCVFTENIPEAILKVRKEFPDAHYCNQCFYLPDNDLLYVIEAEGPDRLSEVLLGPII